MADSSTLDPAEIAQQIATEIAAQGLNLNALATASACRLPQRVLRF